MPTSEPAAGPAVESRPSEAHTPSPRRHGALLRFISRLALFSLPIALVSAWLEHGLRGMDTTYGAMRRGFEAASSRVQIIVLGSSAAAKGINPSRFSEFGYNLANGSQSVHYDIALVEKYLPRLPLLRLVVWGMPYFYMSYELKNYQESWRQHFYATFWGVPVEEPSHSFITIQQHSFVALYTPLTSLEYGLRGFRGPSYDGLMANGWEAAEPLSAAEHEAGVGAAWTRVRAAGHRSGMREESARRNVRAFRAFASDLGAKGVRIAVVWLPVTSEYTSDFGEALIAEQRRMLMNAIAGIGGVDFFDYSTDARFGVDDFANADHLAASGTAKLSNILEAEVVRPLLERAAVDKP